MNLFRFKNWAYVIPVRVQNVVALKARLVNKRSCFNYWVVPIYVN